MLPKKWQRGRSSGCFESLGSMFMHIGTNRYIFAYAVETVPTVCLGLYCAPLPTELGAHI